MSHAKPVRRKGARALLKIIPGVLLCALARHKDRLTERDLEIDHQRRAPGGSGGHGVEPAGGIGAPPQGTVVERNREIVDRDAFREIHLSEGDVLELVRLVGGG